MSKSVFSWETATPRSIGSEAAALFDRVDSVAATLKARFPDGFSKETEKEIKLGMFDRYTHAAKFKTYWIERTGTNYIVLDQAPTKPNESHTKVDVPFCLSFTPSDITKMKRDNAALYDIVTPIRNSASTYVSKRFSRLEAAMEKVGKVPPPRDKKLWEEAANTMFETLIKRIATAQARGDTTVPDKGVLQRKIAAFWAAK
jgi:hypothetical protein